MNTLVSWLEMPNSEKFDRIESTSRTVLDSWVTGHSVTEPVCFECWLAEQDELIGSLFGPQQPSLLLFQPPTPTPNHQNNINNESNINIKLSQNGTNGRCAVIEDEVSASVSFAAVMQPASFVPHLQ